MSLFGNAGSSRTSNKHLVEFRAGKMTLKGTTVTPDKRKGLIYVHQSDDSLIHFCWKDRTSGKLEDDLIIFPDDCEFKRVAQCTTGRVYILRFKTSARKFFFWMQEPKTDKDEEHCKKVNDSLNNPPAPGQSSGSDLSGMDQGSGNLQELFANMDQQQLLQLMGGGGLGSLFSGGTRSSNRTSSRTQVTSSSRSSNRTTTTTTTAAPTTTTTGATERASVTPAPSVVTPSPAVAASEDSASTGVQLSQLQNILSQMGMPAERGAEAEPVNLSKAITPDVMIPILANPEVQERLKPFLPQGESIPATTEELKATVQSAQFRQAMSSFSDALATGQLGPVLKQFGLPQSAQEAAAKGDVEGFAKAMQDDTTNSKKDDQEDMMVE